jgi:hypothetical protein
MCAFSVHLNGKKLCLAGIGEDGVLTAIVDWVSKEGRANMSLQVGGLVGGTGEHVRWVPQKPLKSGDRIQITLVEKSSVAKPRQVIKTDPGADLRAQKHYVRMMAKKFGWKIQARP